MDTSNLAWSSPPLALSWLACGWGKSRVWRKRLILEDKGKSDGTAGSGKSRDLGTSWSLSGSLVQYALILSPTKVGAE